MKVLKQTLQDAAVMTLDGEFDSFVTNAFTGEIDKIIAAGTPNIVLNMKAVTFVNSTALGSMIKCRKACKKEHGDLLVTEPSAAVREAMESLGLDRLFAIYDTDDEALQVLRQGPGLEMEGSTESTVMISVPGGPGTIVGHIKQLDTDAMVCRVEKIHEGIVPGRTLSLKFRLKLYRKEFFELKARVETLEKSGAAHDLGLHFTDISDADRADIESFVQDMKNLRNMSGG